MNIINKHPYIITGGGSGIGQALAWKLAEQDEKVIIIGRTNETLETTCRKFPQNIMSIVGDVASEKGRTKTTSALKSIPHFKGIIHCAGVIQPVLPLMDVSYKSWRNIQSINVDAPLFLTQKLLPKLKNSRILLLSSLLAYFPATNLAPYCISKRDVASLYQCFNLELQSLGIYTGCVLPGYVDTSINIELASEVLKPSFPKKCRRFWIQFFKKNTPIKPAIVACFLQWLLCSTDVKTFSSKEWEISDPSHHQYWLKDLPTPKTLIMT